MKEQKLSLQKPEKLSERGMAVVVRLLGRAVILIVAAITFYLLYKGIPFFIHEGIPKMLLGSVWKPLEAEPQYGISYMIGATVFGSFGAMAIAMPVGTAAAIFMTELAPKWFCDVLTPVTELLAGIPSVVYGMAGLTVITPFLYQLERKLYSGKMTLHTPSGGANLLAAILVLAMLVLPAIVISTKEVIKAVPQELKNNALALGATKLQVIFSVTLQSAKTGILTAGLLGLLKVFGETMAISFVAGGVVCPPLPFSAVRFLTATLAGEMGYAVGIHREALFSIGLILYVCIMLIIGGIHELTKKQKNAG